MESGVITGLSQDDLDLSATLSSGQVFRWERDGDGTWAGVLGRRRVRLAQDRDGGSLHWEADGPNAAKAVRDFLRLDDLNLPAAAAGWCAADDFFAEAWARQPGIRVLRQEPRECFFSFLCASVAPIARIRHMLQAAACAYGEPLGEARGVPLTAFPRPARLAEADEATLRRLGLGFRARRVVEAARILAQDEDSAWPACLRGRPLAVCRRELRAFFGVGEKIADCVCLFALDKDDAIPVDTHIWRMARARYAPNLHGRSLTPAAYARVGAAFRDRFGPFAGWAQQTLFYQAAIRSS